jgi:hypothetical protein
MCTGSSPSEIITVTLTVPHARECARVRLDRTITANRLLDQVEMRGLIDRSADWIVQMTSPRKAIKGNQTFEQFGLPDHARLTVVDREHAEPDEVARPITVSIKTMGGDRSAEVDLDPYITPAELMTAIREHWQLLSNTPWIIRNVSTGEAVVGEEYCQQMRSPEPFCDPSLWTLAGLGTVTGSELEVLTGFFERFSVEGVHDWLPCEYRGPTGATRPSVGSTGRGRQSR